MWNRVTHLSRKNDCLSGNWLRVDTPFDDPVQYGFPVISAVEPEEVLVDVVLEVFLIAV